MHLTESGSNGPLFRVVLLVGKENKTEHELVPTYPPWVVEIIVWVITWKWYIVTKDLVRVYYLNVDFDTDFCHKLRQSIFTTNITKCFKKTLLHNSETGLNDV